MTKNEKNDNVLEKSEAKKEAERRAAAGKHARSADEAAVESKAKAKAEKKPVEFVVMEGKSLATCRGIIDAGAPVTALDFCKFASQADEGKKRLDELVEKGYIQERKARGQKEQG